MLIYLRCTSNLDSKNFFKAMDQNSAGIMYLKNTFPTISDVKIKEGVFVGPLTRDFIQN